MARRVTRRHTGGFLYGTRCGERTRTGGVCVLTQGHSGGHRKAPARRKR